MKREAHAAVHTFCRSLLLVLGRWLLVTRSRCHHWRILVLFKIQGEARIGLIKSSEHIWRPVLPVFPEHSVPPSWSPPWAPFRGCWRSAAAVARDSTHVEADGKCQSPVHKTNKGANRAEKQKEMVLKTLPEPLHPAVPETLELTFCCTRQHTHGDFTLT